MPWEAAPRHEKLYSETKVLHEMPTLVNNEPLDEALIRDEARSIRPRLHEAMQGEDPAAIEARVKQWARENVIERTLLRQAAFADPRPLSADAIEDALRALQTDAPGTSGCRTGVETEEMRQGVELRLRIDRLLSDATVHLSQPRNKDVTDFYRKHRENFVAPERVHAAHIVKNVDENTTEEVALAAIQKAEQELKSGASFAEVADRCSDCPGQGGDLGTFPPGQMVDAFDAVVFALDAGQVSPIFRTQFGFHIAKVFEKKPEGISSLEEVRSQIEQTIFAEKKQRAIEQYLDRLWKKAEIKEQ